MATKNFYSNEYWTSISDHLGGVYPYYSIEDKSSYTLAFPEIIAERYSKNLDIQFDTDALVAKFCLPYLLGDRTLIKNVRKTPWMSEYQADGQWKPSFLPKHGKSKPNPDKFTLKLKEALLNEAKEYIGDKKNIGILLSGGMDSRILAGILRELQLSGDNSFRVIALTWGSHTSRDVVYANKISDLFGWDLVHFPITPETLARNIEYAGIHGAEFSPFHLHAMKDVSNTPNIDVIIAGSYGDSVGRAEFSGVHLTKLKPILPLNIDKYGFLNHQSLRQARSKLRSDLTESKHYSMFMPKVRKREIEQELHYMRRMLQACMQTIAIKTPLYQLFTKPDVFGLMWGLDPSIRNNDWYKLLLQQLPGNLLSIPWARNGKRYDDPNGDTLDNFDKGYHVYGQWIRNELREDVLERVNSDCIRNLGIFNESGLDNIIINWSKATTKTTNSLDESVSWLCSLHAMINTYSIDSYNIPYDNSRYDLARSYIGNQKANLYVSLRNKFRA